MLGRMRVLCIFESRPVALHLHTKGRARHMSTRATHSSHSFIEPHALDGSALHCPVLIRPIRHIHRFLEFFGSGQGTFSEFTLGLLGSSPTQITASTGASPCGRTSRVCALPGCVLVYLHAAVTSLQDLSRRYAACEENPKQQTMLIEHVVT